MIKYITKIVGDLGERAPRVSFYAFEARFAHQFATNLVGAKLKIWRPPSWRQIKGF